MPGPLFSNRFSMRHDDAGGSMLNRFIRATSDAARRKASQSAAWALFARDSVSGFLKTAHHTLTILGIFAIAALGAMFVKPDLADRLLAFSPFIEEASAEEDEIPPLAGLM